MFTYILVLTLLGSERHTITAVSGFKTQQDCINGARTWLTIVEKQKSDRPMYKNVSASAGCIQQSGDLQ